MLDQLSKDEQDTVRYAMWKRISQLKKEIKNARFEIQKNFKEDGLSKLRELYDKLFLK